MVEYDLLQHKVETTDGEKLWYIAELYGIVMEVDIKSKILKCLWKIPDNPKVVAYRGIYHCERKLYIIPFTGVMYEYDLDNNTYDYINLDANLKLMSAIRRGDYLYFYGWNPTVVRLSITDKKIEYIDTQTQLMELGIDLGECFWTESFVEEENIYLPVQNANVLIRIDKDDIIGCIVLGDKYEKWSSRNIHLYNKKIYSIHTSGGGDDLYIVNSVYNISGKIENERVIPFKEKYSIYPFLYGVYSDSQWILLPYGLADFYCVRHNCEKINRLYSGVFGTDDAQRLKSGAYTYCVIFDNNILYAVNQMMGKLLCIDLTTLNVQETDIYFDRSSAYMALTDKDLSSKSFMLRENYADLKKFLNLITTF